MGLHATGSATGMDHHFTHPARVVEIDRREQDEEDLESDDFLPSVPPATDDGTPLGTVRRQETEPR
jgi:hypothetical protein